MHICYCYLYEKKKELSKFYFWLPAVVFHSIIVATLGSNTAFYSSAARTLSEVEG
jgi:hypothetical protein